MHAALMKFNSISEMMRYHFLRPASTYVQKTDAPYASNTSGIFNAIYGAKITVQSNTEANVWGLLPKVPYGKSGWRVESAKATYDSGVAETAALPDSKQMTNKEISTTPKLVPTVFENTLIQELLSKSDDAYGDMPALRNRFAIHHIESINTMLLKDFDTLASNDFESIDRVTASTALQSAVGATVGDEDIYGIDRSANSWADAYVDHNSGTDRDLSDSILRGAVVDNLPERGANPTLYITGTDGKSAIIGEYAPGVRYGGEMSEGVFQVGMNGVQTDSGKNFGVRVSTNYGVPIFVSKSVQKDTLSRIYILDTTDPDGQGVPRLAIELNMPTQYFEAGIDSGTPWAINKFGNKGMYVTVGELKCRGLPFQGSIRDLQ